MYKSAKIYIIVIGRMKMLYVIKILFLGYFSFINFSYSKENLLDLLREKKEFSTFYQLIKIANYEDLFNEKTQFKKVIYIPKNEAFLSLPSKVRDMLKQEDVAKKIVRTHLYSGEVKEVFKNPDKRVVILERVELNGEAVKIFSNEDLFVKDIVNKNTNIVSKEYSIIPVECVMFLQPSFEDFRLTKKQKQESLITSCCLLSDREIEVFISDRYL